MVEVNGEAMRIESLAASVSNMDFGPDSVASNDEASFEVIDHADPPFSLIPSENTASLIQQQPPPAVGTHTPEQLSRSSADISFLTSACNGPKKNESSNHSSMSHEQLSKSSAGISFLASAYNVPKENESSNHSNMSHEQLSKSSADISFFTSAFNVPKQNESQLLTPSMSFIAADSVTASMFNPSPLCSEESQTGIQTRIDQVLQENINLKETLQQNNLALKQHSAELLHWREEVSKVHQAHRLKFQETREQFQKLKEQNAAMHKTIEEQSKQIKRLEAEAEAVRGPSQSEITLTNMVQQLSAQIQAADIALKEKASSAKTSEEQLLALREENKMLKKNVEDLSSLERHNNDYQQAKNQGFSLRVDELTAQLLNVEQELEHKERELKALREQRGVHCPPMSDETEERLRKRIDDMTALIVEKDAQIEAKSTEMNSMNIIISRLEKDNEAIPILQAQVEVYRTDFNAEREAREHMVTEKEQLAEDLRTLHRRNEELQEEIRTLQARGEEENHFTRERTPLPSEEPVPPPRQYACPNCEMLFQQVDLLALHVEDCLQLSWFVCKSVICIEEEVYV